MNWCIIGHDNVKKESWDAPVTSYPCSTGYPCFHHLCCQLHICIHTPKTNDEIVQKRNSFTYVHVTIWFEVYMPTEQQTHVHYSVPHEMVFIPIISVYKDFRVKLEPKRWLERLCNVKKNNWADLDADTFSPTQLGHLQWREILALQSDLISQRAIF